MRLENPDLLQRGQSLGTAGLDRHVVQELLLLLFAVVLKTLFSRALAIWSLPRAVLAPPADITAKIAASQLTTSRSCGVFCPSSRSPPSHHRGMFPFGRHR